MADPTYQTSFDQLVRRSQSPSAIFGPVGAPGDPNSVIGKAIAQNNMNAIYSFPLDMPDNHFVIYQSDWQMPGSTAANFGELISELTSGAISTATNAWNNGVPLNVGTYKPDGVSYRLPLPMNLESEFTINFDSDFNFMAAAGAVARQIPVVGGLAGAAGAAADVGAAAAGLAINTFKTVTLTAPSYRSLRFEWRLHPKNFAESQIIQRIIYQLQRNMHPSLGLNNLVFKFPKVFFMQFALGPQYLFKFKPAVLRGINVEYTGGTGIPAFYKNAGNRAVPQGVVIRTNWLELEYWTKENFDVGADTDGGTGPNDPWAGLNSARDPGGGNPGGAGTNPGNVTVEFPNANPGVEY